jgi:PAS domain S-box-containing protein
MQLRLAALRRVRGLLDTGALTREQFAALGPEVKRDLFALRALYNMDAEGVVRWVAPETEENRRAVGQDLRQPGGGAATFREVVPGGEPRLTPPVHLLQGGRGVLAFVPGEDGFLGAVFALPDLVTGSLDGALREGYRLTVMDGDEVLATGKDGIGSPWPWVHRRSLTVAGRTWRLALAPTRALRASLSRRYPDLVLLFGVTLGLGLAVLQRRFHLRVGRIRRREARYRSIFANAQIGIFRIETRTGRLLEANPLMARIFGYDDAEAFVRDYSMAEGWVDPSDAERMMQAFEDGQGVISNFEARFRTRSGEPLWVRFSARLFEDEGYMEGVGQSIESEKQTTRALVESEQRFRDLAESVSAMILITDDDGRLVYANHEATRSLGFSNKELMEMGVGDLLAPDSRDKFERVYRAPGGGESRLPSRMELRFKNAAGTERWFEVSGALVELGEGRGQGRLATCFDITERMVTGEALRKSEARYRTIFETTGTATVILDEDARIILANAGFASLTGYSLGELETMSWGDFFHGDTGEAVVDVPQRLQTWDSVVPESYEVRLTDRYGRAREGIVTVNLIPGTIQRVASFLDLTERKQAERQMFRAEKMAALGQIIAGVAHEINNPNNFIYFNLPILKRYIDGMKGVLDRVAGDEPDLRLVKMPYEAFMEDVYNLVDNMQHGSSRITDIVSELRQHVRDEDEQKRPDSLETVVERAVNLVGKQVRKMVRELEVELEKPLPRVLMNAGKIEQVLINLVINAAQAADKDDSWVRLSARKQGERVVLRVEDNGCGIPDHVQEQIFDPFFTTKGRDAGTGLGLSISQRIIEEHGGHLGVSSTEGEGSCFTVDLPSYTSSSDDSQEG